MSTQYLKKILSFLFITLFLNLTTYAASIPDSTKSVNKTTGGWLDIISGVTVSPSTVTTGNNFQVTYTIKEVDGEAISLSTMSIFIMDSNNNEYKYGEVSNINFSAYSSYVFNTTISTSFYPLNVPGTYRASARAQLANGTWITFSTGAGVNPRTFYIVAPSPTIPLLQSPSNGTTTDDTTPNLTWSADNANYFHVQIDNNSNFSSPERENTNVGAFNWTPSSMSDGTYYWRVRSHGTDGSWSSCVLVQGELEKTAVYF